MKTLIQAFRQHRKAALQFCKDLEGLAPEAQGSVRRSLEAFCQPRSVYSDEQIKEYITRTIARLQPALRVNSGVDYCASYALWKVCVLLMVGAYMTPYDSRSVKSDIVEALVGVTNHMKESQGLVSIPSEKYALLVNVFLNAEHVANAELMGVPLEREKLNSILNDVRRLRQVFGTNGGLPYNIR